jgi:hypothetical protein
VRAPPEGAALGPLSEAGGAGAAGGSELTGERVWRKERLCAHQNVERRPAPHVWLRTAVTHRDVASKFRLGARVQGA